MSPESLAISILPTQPPYAFEINEKESRNVLVIKNLTVECFLLFGIYLGSGFIDILAVNKKFSTVNDSCFFSKTLPEQI